MIEYIQGDHFVPMYAHLQIFKSAKIKGLYCLFLCTKINGFYVKMYGFLEKI